MNYSTIAKGFGLSSSVFEWPDVSESMESVVEAGVALTDAIKDAIRLEDRIYLTSKSLVISPFGKAYGTSRVSKGFQRWLSTTIRSPHLVPHSGDVLMVI